MTYSHSLVVIAPVALWSTVIELNAALGYDPGDGLRLSATSNEPATHLGLHTWSQVGFVAIATGQVMPDIEDITAQQITDLLDAITVSVDPVVDDMVLTKSAHFNHVLASAGLSVIAQEI